MDNKINDKDSPEYHWLMYLHKKRADDFMWQSTDHGPGWTDKEIKKAVNEFINNFKQTTSGKAYLKDFNPQKSKKKLIEYIKKNT